MGISISISISIYIYIYTGIRRHVGVYEDIQEYMKTERGTGVYGDM